MPELPEVETVKRRLSPHLIGKTIRDVKVFYKRYKLLEPIKDETINAIDRKGKFLIFTLDHYIMISHLRMEGKYMIKVNPEKTKHDHVFFEFDDFTLVYNDTRKFGMFYLFDRGIDVYSVYPLKELGREPFTATKDYLLEKLNGKTGHIKSLLLDQSILAGLGNIYVDEVLFMSKVNPFREGRTITGEEAEKIIANSVTVLNKAIEAGGTTVRSFASFNGESGHFQGSLLVHEREGQKCPVCGNIILKTKVNGRGTFLCPTCEKLRDYRIYAITGTYASGKSTVLGILESMGYFTLSSDQIYADLLNNCKKMQREIKKAFGTTDREVLREIVYNNQEKNSKLKKITHPYVIKELFSKAEKADASVIFAEVPLVFEGGFAKAFDGVIDVYQSETVQNAILKNKGIDPGFALKVDQNQLSKDEKKNESNYVVLNDGTLSDLENHIQTLLKEMKL